MAIDSASIGQLALDSQGLDKLRLQARQSPEQALKTAAQQFETVFLDMMLKSMREATPQDGMFDSEQTRMFTGMLDQQLAQNMSARGVGLADVMVRQLSPAQLASPVAPGAAAQPAIPSAYRASFQQSFVDRMRPHAQQASRDSGIPAHLILGQAALESGWGRREIRNADGSDSHNLFGIKAGKDWKGQVAEVTTTEYRDGVVHRQVERFRAYDSYAEGFRDYARLLGSDPRYADVLRQKDAQGFALALQRAGYATDPVYADKLARVIGSVSALA